MKTKAETWIPWAVIVAAVMAAVFLVNPAQSSTVKLRIAIDGKIATATLTDSASTRDFVSLLPLTIEMRDLMSREKFADLPRPLAEGGVRVRSYDMGDLVYWSPGPHLAIFYRDDGQSIPPPDIIILGKLEGNLDRLQQPGPVAVTIEAIGNQ